MKVVAIVPDAYGGHGGIALYGRCILRALCEHPARPEVVAIPRVVPLALEPMPLNLEYREEVAHNKWRYAASVLRVSLSHPNLVICGHLNLLPLAAAAAAVARVPLILLVYGMEAWRPHPNPAVRALLPRVTTVIAIRRYTLRRFLGWARVRNTATVILENPVSLERFGAGPASQTLVDRYGLGDKQVLLTLARVEYENFGFDEIIETLPRLLPDHPRLQYVIAGAGDHIERLRRKASALGVGDRVTFTGFVRNDEKKDHYRLAHAFAMPGTDPLQFDRYPFRFVLLEALACGLPVVLSQPEDPDELPSDLPYFPVNPASRASIAAGIRAALARGPGSVPPGLNRYDFTRFANRLRHIVDTTMRGPPRPDTLVAQ